MAKFVERIEYPDGSALEVTVSGAVNGPDKEDEPHLHYGTTYVYLRAPGKAWRKSWHRSLHRTKSAARACPSAVEAYVRVGEAEGPTGAGKVAIRCPDCGDVEVVPDVTDRGVPASGECPGCGDRLFFGV